MRRTMFFTAVVIGVLIGWLGGMLVQAAVISAREPQAVKVIWSRPCDGDRVVVTKAMMVRCVKEVPPPQPTPTPAPTQGILSTEPIQTETPCGSDPNYWTSCPPTEVPYP